MTRFKKGIKVEVLTQKDVPSGSWCCAEIIGGNGHNYTVRYDGNVSSFGQAKVERVPRKVIRPCPPSVDVVGDWMPGDVVEVFHNFSWKMATVLMVSGWTHLVVRLLGSAIEFKAHRYDVRARLCWQEGEWVVIGKASNMYEDMRFRVPSSEKKMDAVQDGHLKGDFMSMRNSNGGVQSQSIPLRVLKRKSSECHHQIEGYAAPSQKIRVGQESSLRRQLNVIRLPPLPEKVDDDACSQEVLAEKCINPSLINKMTGCTNMILEREKRDGDGNGGGGDGDGSGGGNGDGGGDGDGGGGGGGGGDGDGDGGGGDGDGDGGGAVGCPRSTSLEFSHGDNVSSSIGSCSLYRICSRKLHHMFAPSHFEDNDYHCSDAESICPLRFEEKNCVLPAKEDFKEEVHRLEVHAYRSTIEALHASGPLSWEQELLLTNLRDSLHISNDEHLMEIRNLVSPSTCIPPS